MHEHEHTFSGSRFSGCSTQHIHVIARSLLCYLYVCSLHYFSCSTRRTNTLTASSDNINVQWRKITEKNMSAYPNYSTTVHKTYIYNSTSHKTMHKLH